MKKIDYYWPNAFAKITSIILLTQAFVGLIADRRPGFEWVLTACLVAFAVSWVVVFIVLLWNAYVETKKGIS